jgi:hypothetical protein
MKGAQGSPPYCPGGDHKGQGMEGTVMVGGGASGGTTTDETTEDEEEDGGYDYR